MFFVVVGTSQLEYGPPDSRAGTLNLGPQQSPLTHRSLQSDQGIHRAFLLSLES